ncbi:MAG: aminopeptidase P family protein [Clostridia bacterium]|nr:aminopeptidase P family protein [Clostridia bacterium]
MNRCDRLRQSMMEDEAVLITSCPNIFYYSGFTSEDAKIVITKSQQMLFTDSRYTIQARLEAKGFDIYDKADDFKKAIKGLECKIICFEEEALSVAQYEKLKAFGKELKPFSKEIKKPRETKDSAELRKIAEAERLGDEAFSYILKHISVGRTEKEIASELEFFMRKNGASALSFETICASGVRSAMPHGTASDKVIKKGDFVTLDFGCILDGYCSDMTRTIVMGTPSQKQKEIYDVVLKAQISAINAVKCGARCADCDMAARKIIEDAGYGNNFGHGTGHSVGIEIHESPNLSPKSDAILQAGNVVTVEPGIYIDGFGGVRIEDLVQINDQNTENLTKSVKDLIII